MIHSLFFTWALVFIHPSGDVSSVQMFHSWDECKVVMMKKNDRRYECWEIDHE